MNYTIKIDHNEKKAEKLIQLIKALVGDSPYVGIYEDETGLSEEMEQELDMRYQQVLKNPQEGKSWEEVKKGLHHVMGQTNTCNDGQLWSQLTEEEQVELLKIEREVQSGQGLIPNEQMKAKHKK